MKTKIKKLPHHVEEVIGRFTLPPLYSISGSEVLMCKTTGPRKYAVWGRSLDSGKLLLLFETDRFSSAAKEFAQRILRGSDVETAV